jgi:hypothetical protein
MSIANAVQKGALVFVYDERGRTLYSKSVGSQPGSGLLGFTSSTVSIRNGTLVFTYNEKGGTLFSKSVR